MKFAIIRLKGNQYKVREGQSLEVSKLGGETKPEVLLVSDDNDVLVGKPVLEKSKVIFDVIEETAKGKKVNIFTFKAKARYRKKKGFRPLSSRIKIKSIS